MIELLDFALGVVLLAARRRNHDPALVIDGLAKLARWRQR